MEASNENVRRWILRVLYAESNTLNDVKCLSPSSLSDVIGMPLSRIGENIEYLLEKDLVSQTVEGVKLTEKGIWAIRQYERTFCPYL